MNPIEQMMQAFGATSAQSMAAFMGTSAAAESNAAEFANQFAAALQNSETNRLTVDSSWRLAATTDVSAIDNIATTDGLLNLEGPAAAFSGFLQGQLIAPTAQAAEADLRSLPQDGAVSFAVESFAVPAEGAFQPYAEGIPGLQLVTLSGLDLASLIESGQLQSFAGADLPTNTQIPQGLGANDQFLFAAQTLGGDNQQVRLLPIAQLDAISFPELRPDLAAGTPQILAPAPVAGETVDLPKAPHAGVKPDLNPQAADAQVQTQARPEIAQATSSEPANASAIPQAAATDQLPANTVAATDAAPLTEANSKAASAIFTPSGGRDSVEQLAPKTPDQSVAASPDNKSAEGHAVQQNSQNGKKTPNAALAQVQAPTADAPANQAASQASAAAISQTKATPSPRDPLTSKSSPSSPSDRQSAKQTTSVAPRQAQQPAAQQASMSLSWTPERLAGIPEGVAPAEAVAGGLSGLRGEPGFLNSMGLMGGRPSPALGGHVAKQVNLQVSRAVNNGTNEFTMRLNPTELGQVRIKMAFNDAGRVSAQLFVERPETLELLQREVKGLEKAVESGGHKLEQGGLSFNLDTGDGQSAGKAFAEAVHQDRLKDEIENKQAASDEEESDAYEGQNDLTDLAALEEILSRVTLDTGLDVRV